MHFLYWSTQAEPKPAENFLFSKTKYDVTSATIIQKRDPRETTVSCCKIVPKPLQVFRSKIFWKSESYWLVIGFFLYSNGKSVSDLLVKKDCHFRMLKFASSFVPGMILNFKQGSSKENNSRFSTRFHYQRPLLFLCSSKRRILLPSLSFFEDTEKRQTTSTFAVR